MSNGTAFRLPPLTHPTSVIASGLWRTGEPLFPTLHGTPNPDNPRRAGPSGNELGREVNRRERDLMPTLTSTEVNRGPGRSAKRKGGDNLLTAVLMPTLTARDWKSGKASEATHTKRTKGGFKKLKETVVRQETLLPTLTATRRSGLQSHGENAILGSLNPTWCEWYMGLPIGWSELEPSETSTRRSSPNSSAGRSSKRKG
jgi:hypothetical protein